MHEPHSPHTRSIMTDGGKNRRLLTDGQTFPGDTTQYFQKLPETRQGFW